MLTKRQIELIRDSFATTDASAEDVIQHLFNNLFQIEPGLRYLFPENLTDVKRRFGFMLGSLVHRLDRWDEVVPRLRNLGVRHVSYGVQVRHYKVLGEALLATLSELLQLEAKSECAQAWTALYDLVATTMIAASAETKEFESSLPVPSR